MTEKKTLAAKLLYKFLKKKCMLIPYINNVMEQNKGNDDVKKFYEKSDILGIINFCNSSIYWAFVWKDTKEGFRFWYDLDNEFWIF